MKTAESFSDSSLRHTIAHAVLRQVPLRGWTDAAYTRALKEVNIERNAVDKAFPKGLYDVVDMFGTMTDEAMEKRIKAEKGFDRFRVRDKVTFAVRVRIEALTPHREAMRHLLTWYAMPHHLPFGIKRFYKTVDRIWITAGDTSTDYNFYTKRLLLASVMKATTLFWLRDNSPGNAATWTFLDHRIADVMKFGKNLRTLKEFKPSDVVNLVRDKFRKAA